MSRVIIVTLMWAIASCTQTKPSPKITAESALAHYLQGTLPSYQVAYFDLNDDGKDDAIIYLHDPKWCGSAGCTSLIFVGTGDGFAFQSKMLITQTPIYASIHKTQGWFDLIVSTRGVGQVVMAFNGATYPINPSAEPKASQRDQKRAIMLIK